MSKKQDKNKTSNTLDKELKKVGGTLSPKELEQIRKRLGISVDIIKEAAQEAEIKIKVSPVKNKPSAVTAPTPAPAPAPVAFQQLLNQPKPTEPVAPTPEPERVAPEPERLAPAPVVFQQLLNQPKLTERIAPTPEPVAPTPEPVAPEPKPGLTDAEKLYYKNQLFEINADTGDSSVIDINIENLVNQENQNKFNYLVQDVLSKTVREVNKNLAKENNIKYLSNLQGFDEVINFTSNLSNSLLADSGIGGYLAMSGQGEAAKNLEKGVKSMLGQGDSMSYNWQKWFDGELADKYANLKEITNPEDAKQIHKIDEEFAKQFVENYLKPRFDSSKSMSEFISYIDVKEGEQNILQTQTLSNRLKQLAEGKTDAFLSQLTSKPTNTDLYAYVVNDLNPYLSSVRAEYGEEAFLQFMTPDQLADQLTKSIDPLKTPEAWDETLKQYGIDSTNKSIDEVRDLILQTTRTAPAEDIRESIKKLNEKKTTPTQKNLGIDYIQRTTDDVSKSTGKETALYGLFKTSGYGGTEEEFYKNFMPDVTEEDKELMSGVLGKDKSKLGFNIDTSDPFAAIGSLESLFGDKVKTVSTEEKPDYFSLFGEAEKKDGQFSSKDSTFNIFDF